MDKRFYLEVAIVFAWFVLVCALQPPFLFHPDPYWFFVVPFLLGAMSWGAVKGPSFKPHYRHQDTNWILKKDWFRRIMNRDLWRPKTITAFWKFVLFVLLLLPGSVIALASQPAGLAEMDLARYVTWSLLLGLSVALGGTMLLETLVQQALGNIITGLGFALVAFSGFYVWQKPLLEKTLLLLGGLLLAGLGVFATDLARAWEAERE